MERSVVAVWCFLDTELKNDENEALSASSYEVVVSKGCKFLF
jgi:hypothetical protein